MQFLQNIQIFVVTGNDKYKKTITIATSPYATENEVSDAVKAFVRREFGDKVDNHWWQVDKATEWKLIA